MTWFAIFGFFCLAASFTHPNFYLSGFLDVIHSNHDEFVAISKPDNLIHFPRPVEGWVDVVFNAPWALFSGLFRPLPFEPVTCTVGRQVCGLFSRESSDRIVSKFIVGFGEAWNPRSISLNESRKSSTSEYSTPGL